MDEAPEIKCGSLVTLKSGGPRMTAGFIDRTVDVPYAIVAWFSESGVYNEKHFPLDSLNVMEGLTGIKG